MNLKKITIGKVLSVLLFIVVTSNLVAVSNGAAIFTLIEPNSRAGGMGHAFVAQADDGFATYWNTGSMAFNRKTQFAFMHTNWFQQAFDDIYLDYVSWNTYIQDIGNIGISGTFMNYGEQVVYDENGVAGDTFVSWDLAVGFNYGYQYSETLGLGTTFKVLYSKLSEEGQGNTDDKGTAFNYAFDFAMKKKGLNLFNNDFLSVLDNVDFGFNLQNVGPDMTYVNDEQSDPLAMNWRMGLSYRAIDKPGNKLTLNADINKELENDDFVLLRIFSAWFDDPAQEEIDSTIFNIGGEYIYLDLISLRAGYIYDKAGDIKGPSFGAGIMHDFKNMYKIKFDFAAQEAGELQDDFNITYSVGFEF